MNDQITNVNLEEFDKLYPIKNKEDFNKSCLNGEYLRITRFKMENIYVTYTSGFEYACEGGWLPIVKYIATFFLDPHLLKNAIYKACLNGHLDIFNFLLRQYAYNTSFIMHGASTKALIGAIQGYPTFSQNMEMINVLLYKYDKIIDLNTGLFYACKLGLTNFCAQYRLIFCNKV